MTLSELLALLYERLSYQSGPAAAVTTRLTNNLNEAQRRILRSPGVLNAVSRTTHGLTFASVSGQAIYGLPASIGRVRHITDRTNDRRLQPATLHALRAGDPGLDGSGTPSAWVGMGYKPYKAIPGSTGIWAASSSASDTTPTIQINGVVSDGTATGDVVATLTGTTRVQLGTATDYLDLTAVSLSATCIGAVTLYNASSGGTALSTIPIGHISPQYYVVQLYPTPNAAITYYVDGSIRVPFMDDNTDSPLLPEEFHDLVIYGAMMIEYEKTDDPRLTLSRDLYREGLSDLKYALSSQGSELIFGRPAQGTSTSRLGSWTPAGSGY